ncbi:MAG: M67 family metallopeptidase [Erythrobacter sp.]
MTSQTLSAMIAAAHEAHPNEACGILLGRLTGHAKCDSVTIAAFIPTKNVHQSPQTHFEIDPQTLIDAHRNARHGGAQVIGCFHSHPKGVAKPSQTDLDLAANDGAIWAIFGAVVGADADPKAIRFFRAPVEPVDGFGERSFAELFIVPNES